MTSFSGLSNKIKLLLAGIVFSLTLLIPSTVFASTLAVTSPNGGENYTVGQNVHITWSASQDGSCTISYITPEGGLSTSYFIGSTNALAGSFDWAASKPSSSVSSQQEKIELVCAGMPVAYSADYYTVNDPVQPVCDRSATVSFTDTSTPSIYRGQSISNQVAITNPNDSSCGSTLYGLSNSYPGGWTMNIPYSVSVPAGSTVDVPFTLTASSDAAYQTYSYSVYAGDSSGGVLPGATGSVSVVPECDATVQATLAQSSQNASDGDTISNNLVLTNPNPVECSSKTYVYSRSYPSDFTMSIQPNVTVNSGQTVSVPFTMGVNQSTLPGTYGYQFWVYNSVADGSGQAQLGGTVTVSDNTAPLVSITSPSNGSTVPRRSSVTVNATASDNISVTKVEFYVNGALQCTQTSSPYSCSFNTGVKKNEIYNLTVKAYDASGNVSTTSSNVTTY